MIINIRIYLVRTELEEGVFGASLRIIQGGVGSGVGGTLEKTSLMAEKGWGGGCGLLLSTFGQLNMAWAQTSLSVPVTCPC